MTNRQKDSRLRQNTDIQTDRQTGRYTNRQTDRQTDQYTGRLREIKKKFHASDRRQTDKQTER
jgi:hypothetical protein